MGLYLGALEEVQTTCALIHASLGSSLNISIGVLLPGTLSAEDFIYVGLKPSALFDNKETLAKQVRAVSLVLNNPLV